jgi:hypothetical protein
LGLCVLAAVPASAASAVSAESDNGYGYLSAVEGSATLMQAGSGTRTPAELNQPVLAGDRLWVPARSRVEIVLADRNLLRIDGGSEVALERLAASPDSRDRGTVLRLIEGNLQLVVVRESLGDELPRIDTPNATIYVQDYGVFRVAADQEIFTELVVRSGRAEVVTDRRSEEVGADQQAFVEGESRIDVESAGSYDNLERWARRLDEEGDVDSRYLGDDLRYAAAPLSRHGSWIDIQGTHYWRPRVDAGWRPYWNGRWAYTPSGHTWVSYDPWGWVPHHYGSWDHIPGYGWVWLPGHRWSPAWVYWYQGPSYTGWCPTGYYTRYYGSRWGHGFGFHFGVYGWAGGDWGHFNHWTFVGSDYWRGYRHGYRDGRHDDWRNHRNVQRHAVPIDQMRRHGQLDRGLITTDTRPLTPDVLQDPRRAVAVLRQDPSARRGRSDGDLPDVSDFIARKPELPANLRRAVSTDNDGDQLDGTPLRPGTMGRGDRGDRGARDTRTLPSARAGAESSGREPRSAVIDRGGSGIEPGRVVIDSGNDRGARSGRSTRPSSGDAGGAPRPGVKPQDDSSGDTPRSGRGVRAVPRNDDQGDQGASSDSSSRSGRGARSVRPPNTDGGPAPRSGGGYSRPDRGGSARLDTGTRRPEPSDRRVYEPQPYERPRSTDRGSMTRPSPRASERPAPPSSSRGGYERPSSPRTYERPAPPSSSRGGYERPAPPSSSRGGYERPSSPRTHERPAPPSSSRGGYQAPSRPEPRATPPSSSGGSSRSGSSTRSAPDRGSSDRGTSSRGSSDRGSSSGGRSARRPPQDN